MAQIFYGTDGTVPSSWTTAGRPASPATGQYGYNTTLGSLEIYNGSAWGAIGGGGPGSLQAVQTTGFTAVSGNVYACNTTSAAFTVTLPASPTAGNYVVLVDYARTFGTNNLTINPNGLKISGSTSNAVLSTNGAAVSIIYVDSTQGWLAYTSTFTSAVAAYQASYLVIAGGGAGANASANQSGTGGGGGAGGYIASTGSFTPGTAYTITVGAGGAGIAANNSSSVGNSGSASSISGIVTATGGGGGANNGGTPGNGGSGGGGGAGNPPGAGSGTTGQGFAGGGGDNVNSAGGGGGSGAAGSAGSGGASGVSGNGGAGTASSITGSSVTRAGGGGAGGGINTVTVGSGGSGGGGAGGASNSNGGSGTVNTGSGGGASGCANISGVTSTVTNGSGGSGIVIISYAGSQRGSGGTVTSSGGNTIHTFLSSGTYTA